MKGYQKYTLVLRSPTIASSRQPCRADFANQFQPAGHLDL
jgi:hypothetical protein